MKSYPESYRRTVLKTTISFFLLVLIIEAILSYFYYPLNWEELENKHHSEIKLSLDEYIIQKQLENFNIIKGYAWWIEVADAAKNSNNKFIIDTFSGDKTFSQYYDLFLIANEHNDIIYGVIDSTSNIDNPTKFNRFYEKELEESFFELTSNNKFFQNTSESQITKDIDKPLVWHFFQKYNDEIRLITLSPLCQNNGYPYTKGYLLIGQKLTKILTGAEKLIPAKFVLTEKDEKLEPSKNLVKLSGRNNNYFVNFEPKISLKEISNKTFYTSFLLQITIITIAFLIVFPIYTRKGIKKFEQVIDDQTKELNSQLLELQESRHIIEKKAIELLDANRKLEYSERILEEQKLELKNYVEELHESKDLVEENAAELIQLNFKLEESESQLIELNKRKDKFFSIISHDLRGPFGGLTGLIAFLKDDFNNQSDKDKYEIISTIDDACSNLTALLENLLNWANSQIGSNDIEKENFDINLLTLDIISLYSNNSKSKNIKIENRLKDDSFVFADRNMMDTILRNLINNAIKFTDENGKIIIDSFSDESNFILTIEDNGIGITKDNLNKIFEFDNPIKSVGTSGEPGTGLGLALCKELINKNNGKIWVESEYEKGSKFFISVPIRIKKEH